MKSGIKDATAPTGKTVSAATPVGAARQRGKKPLGKIEIPALYRGPIGDRDLQGCLKARA